MSLRFRLNSILFATIALVFLSGTSLVVFNARQSVRSEVESTVHLAVQLIRAEIADDRLAGHPVRNWPQQLQNLDRTRHLNIDIRSVASSSPETVDTRAYGSLSVDKVPRWFVWSVAPSPVAFSQVIRPIDEKGIELLIQADPSDEIIEAWNEARDFFGLVGGMAVLVFFLVSITVDRAFKPVSTILDGLDRLENGQYRQSLPHFPLPEFSRIANAINQTAAALETARKDNEQLRRHSLEIREQERQYLARELHDEFAQSLSAIKVVAVSLKANNPDRSSLDAIESIQATCDRLFAVLGNLLRRLHPLILDELGLKAALEDMLETWSAQQPSMDMIDYCDPAIDGFSRRYQIHVFRIVQECLTNIVKHARAARVSVRILVEPHRDSDPASCLRIEIHDDGVGFDPDAVRSGFGLRGIRERVEGLGGETSILAAPGRGVRIGIEIPFVRVNE